MDPGESDKVDGKAGQAQSQASQSVTAWLNTREAETGAAVQRTGVPDAGGGSQVRSSQQIIV